MAIMIRLIVLCFYQGFYVHIHHTTCRNTLPTKGLGFFGSINCSGSGITGDKSTVFMYMLYCNSNCIANALWLDVRWWAPSLQLTFDFSPFVDGDSFTQKFPLLAPVYLIQPLELVLATIRCRCPFFTLSSVKSVYPLKNSFYVASFRSWTSMIVRMSVSSERSTPVVKTYSIFWKWWTNVEMGTGIICWVG